MNMMDDDQHLSKNKRTKGKSTHYHVKDTYLNPEYFSEQSALSIKTKVALTTYLAAKTSLTNMQRLSLHPHNCYFPYDGPNVSEPTM